MDFPFAFPMVMPIRHHTCLKKCNMTLRQNLSGFLNLRHFRGLRGLKPTYSFSDVLWIFSRYFQMISDDFNEILIHN